MRRTGYISRYSSLESIVAAKSRDDHGRPRAALISHPAGYPARLATVQRGQGGTPRALPSPISAKSTRQPPNALGRANDGRRDAIPESPGDAFLRVGLVVVVPVNIDHDRVGLQIQRTELRAALPDRLPRLGRVQPVRPNGGDR